MNWDMAGAAFIVATVVALWLSSLGWAWVAFWDGIDNHDRVQAWGALIVAQLVISTGIALAMGVKWE